MTYKQQLLVTKEREVVSWSGCEPGPWKVPGSVPNKGKSLETKNKKVGGSIG